MGIQYVKKLLGIYYHILDSKLCDFIHNINRKILKTYPLIEDCARCRDCGRNVHDFTVPNSLFEEVIGSLDGVWCYDCFCNRSDKKFRFKWRMTFPNWESYKGSWIEYKND